MRVVALQQNVLPKPYSCKQCDYCGAQKCCLERHRTHTGQKLYRCELCNYRSTVNCIMGRQ